MSGIDQLDQMLSYYAVLLKPSRAKYCLTYFTNLHINVHLLFHQVTEIQRKFFLEI